MKIANNSNATSNVEANIWQCWINGKGKNSIKRGAKEGGSNR